MTNDHTPAPDEDWTVVTERGNLDALMSAAQAWGQLRALVDAGYDMSLWQDASRDNGDYSAVALDIATCTEPTPEAAIAALHRHLLAGDAGEDATDG